jgi:hypothetical protein
LGSHGLANGSRTTPWGGWTAVPCTQPRDDSRFALRNRTTINAAGALKSFRVAETARETCSVVQVSAAGQSDGVLLLLVTKPA